MIEKLTNHQYIEVMCKNYMLTFLKKNLTLWNFSQNPTHTGQTGIDTSASFFEYISSFSCYKMIEQHYRSVGEAFFGRKLFWPGTVKKKPPLISDSASCKLVGGFPAVQVSRVWEQIMAL